MAPKFAYAFEAVRDYKKIALAQGVWSDNDEEVERPPPIGRLLNERPRERDALEHLPWTRAFQHWNKP